MEKLLQQLIEGQKQLFDGQKQLFEGQKQLVDGQNRMESRLERVETKMEAMDSRLESVEGQMLESNGFVKALVHQSEYQKVQMDELTHTTARIEGRLNEGFNEMDERFTGFEKDVKTVADDVGFLARKVFTHDDVIRNLKVVK